MQAAAVGLGKRGREERKTTTFRFQEENATQENVIVSHLFVFLCVRIAVQYLYPAAAAAAAAAAAVRELQGVKKSPPSSSFSSSPFPT